MNGGSGVLLELMVEFMPDETPEEEEVRAINKKEAITLALILQGEDIEILLDRLVEILNKPEPLTPNEETEMENILLIVKEFERITKKILFNNFLTIFSVIFSIFSVVFALLRFSGIL